VLELRASDQWSVQELLTWKNGSPHPNPLPSSETCAEQRMRGEGASG
jgi:hypothetical protein